MPLLDLSAIEISSDDPEKVFEEIGVPNRGNHGSVVKARNVQTNEIVAVKKILLKDDNELSDIVNEIVLLSKCNHPNIVKYYGTYKSLSHLWIIMEYCEGGSLDLIYKVLHHPLPESLIAFVCHEVLCGLHYLHSQHRLHRDIKGSNILLTERGEVKLADFGVSTELAHSFSRRNTCTGTVLWMAPEAIQQIDYDDRADIWSLGITLIEMAENAPPRIDIPVPEVIFTIAWQEPPSLKHKEEWSPVMNIFVKRMLTKDPHFRPSAAMLLNDPFVQSDKVGTQAEMREIVQKVIVQLEQFDSDQIRRQDFSTNDTTGTFVAHKHHSTLSALSTSTSTPTSTSTRTASSIINSIHDAEEVESQIEFESEEEEEQEEEEEEELVQNEIRHNSASVKATSLPTEEKANQSLKKVNSNENEEQKNVIENKTTTEIATHKKQSSKSQSSGNKNVKAHSNKVNAEGNKFYTNNKEVSQPSPSAKQHMRSPEQEQVQIEIKEEIENLESKEQQRYNKAHVESGRHTSATLLPEFPLLHTTDFSLEALAEMCLAERSKTNDNEVTKQIHTQLELDVKEGELTLPPNTTFHKPHKLLHITRALQANHAYYQQLPLEYKMSKDEALKTNQIRSKHGALLHTIFNF